MERDKREMATCSENLVEVSIDQSVNNSLQTEVTGIEALTNSTKSLLHSAKLRERVQCLCVCVLCILCLCVCAIKTTCIHVMGFACKVMYT